MVLAWRGDLAVTQVLREQGAKEAIPAAVNALSVSQILFVKEVLFDYFSLPMRRGDC